jgi:LPS sulfotransferase NodH/glycosyltransferase involved in cell wall biosynthesis
MGLQTVPRRRRICFITVEFHGFFKNGGIGTANTALALALAAHGFEVTVALANMDPSSLRTKGSDFSGLRTSYAARGIILDCVPPHPFIAGAFDDPRTASYSVYSYVKDRGFDVVLFNDNGGQGYYTLLAKRMGLFKEPITLCLVAHGPLDWVNDLNALEFHSRIPVLTAYLERRCAGLADILVSPSHYLLNWMTERGWIDPGRGHVIQNLIGELGRSGGLARNQPREVREIVFFARQETRKGLRLFCDALDQLDRTADLSAISVTFLGKFGRIGGLHTGVYIAERARKWRAAVRIIAGYDQSEALDYLSRPGMLAVMPSRAENSPCTVAECLLLGVPFLATDSGGSGELVALEDQKHCLFPPRSDALAERLEEILRHGHKPAQLAVSQSDTLAQWIDLLSLPPAPLKATDQSVKRRSRQAAPLVSVCVAASNTTQFRDLILSLRAQSYESLEIIVAASGGDIALCKAAFEQDGIVIVACDEADIGIGRNRAAAAAAGKYLFFIDETRVLLHQNCIETLVNAALGSQADVLTPLRILTLSDGMPAPKARGWELPVGACIELGLLEPCFGEPAILVTATRFAASKGFTPHCDPTVREWLLLAGMALEGAKLEVVPEELLNMREMESDFVDTPLLVENHRQIISLYGAVPLLSVRRILESNLQVSKQTQVKLQQSLQRLSKPARDIALQLCSINPESKEAFELFVKYCGERRMVNLAMDFALLNDVSFLPEAMQVVSRGNESAVFDAVRARRLHVRQNIDMTAELRGLGRPFWGLPAKHVGVPKNGLMTQSAVSGDGIVKLAAALPPGTLAVYLSATSDAAGPVRLAGVLCRTFARPVLTEVGLISGRDAWWSGWVAAPAPDATAMMKIALDKRSTEMLDLYLIVRRNDDGSDAPININWNQITADVSLNGDGSSSILERATVETPLDTDLLLAGQVITDLSNVSFRIFSPGKRTMLHPLNGRLALVRIANAIPAGASGLRCSVSIEHEKSHAVDFGVWAVPTTAPVRDASQLSDTDNFSDWMMVSEPFKLRSVTLLFADPCTEPMDIYLATRVSTAQDVHFCHAYWHEFWILEPRRGSAQELPTDQAPQGANHLSPSQPGALAMPLKARIFDTPVRSSYLICAAARTGSNLLASALRRTDLAGRPFEYFNAPSQNAEFMLKNLGISLEMSKTIKPIERLKRIIRFGTTENGVFGATVHWWDLEKMYQAIIDHSDSNAPSRDEMIEACAGFFPELRYVWLRRENKVAQAISHYIATKSGVWQVNQNETKPAREPKKIDYDFGKIREFVVSAEVEDDGWRNFLNGTKDALTITYEELAQDYHGTVGKVLDFIGVRVAKDAIPAPQFRRTADSRSFEWEQRYRAEAGMQREAIGSIR